MALTQYDIEAELSYAYLHAVAARAGFGCECTGRHSDNTGVDARLVVKERFQANSLLTNFSLEVQLKATTKEPTLEKERYAYFIKDVERYDELRERSAPLPKILAVLFLPPDPAHWLEQTEEYLLARRCVYWVSLWNAPASSNKTGQTVYLPKKNSLSVAGLRDLARRLSCQEELLYES